MKVFLIGRDKKADIVVAHHSVSRFHAELVVTDEGRLYFADRVSTNGSFVRDEAGEWVRFSEGFIEKDELMRLGEREIRLFADMETSSGVRLGDVMAGGDVRVGTRTDNGGEDMPRGLVSRDPVTGKIIERVL